MTHEVTGRQQAWEVLAERLELEAAQPQANRLKVLLNLPSNAAVAPVYRSRLPVPGAQQAQLYLLDYTEVQPHYPAPRMTSVCLLVLAEAVVSVGLKASRKRHKVLAGLEASAAGGEVLAFQHDPGFEAATTVIARDVALAHQLLTPPVRHRLKLALTERNCEPTFLLGEKQLVFSVSASSPTPLSCLEQLSVDLLSLYAYLDGGAKTKP